MIICYDIYLLINNKIISNQFCLTTNPSVNLSKLGPLPNSILILGLIPLPSLSTFSVLIALITVNPPLVNICANLKASEMHYPIPSTLTLPCFLTTSLDKKSP